MLGTGVGQDLIESIDNGEVCARKEYGNDQWEVRGWLAAATGRSKEEEGLGREGDGDG